jgi:hypothetical protein
VQAESGALKPTFSFSGGGMNVNIWKSVKILEPFLSDHTFSNIPRIWLASDDINSIRIIENRPGGLLF